jgi:glycosyltransferase involved in cell wall biosynthesis
MKIGIDCRYILNTKHGELAGVGHYTYFLIKYLLEIDQENEYILFFYNKKIQCEEFTQQKNIKCIYFPGLENLAKIPLLYRHIFVPYILKKYKLDVYHNPAFVIPLFYFGKSVITIHDLASYKKPSWFPSDNFFNKRILIPSSIYKAKKIIVVSENTRNDLIQMFKVNPQKVKVILEGVEDYNKIEIDETKIGKRFKFNEPYFLFISTLEPRKNIGRLIEAFDMFLKENNDKNYKLVLAGKKGWKYESIFEKIKNLGLEDKVIYLGYVSLEEKIYLLKNSLTFVFPSLYEGFGLPILEAMNLGVPIITSNIASIPELVIDNAILVDPKKTDSIKKAMLKMVKDKDLRERLSQKGKGIAANFTWQETARRTLSLYEKLNKK